MTLQQLHCFCAVAKYHSFARASEELYISQPAVSHSIKALEDELGMKLVRRTLHSCALTEAGERFAIEVEDILVRLDQTVSGMRDNRPFPETLHIGFESTVQIYDLPEVYRRYRAACPKVSLSVREMSLADLHALDRRESLDILFCCERETIPEPFCYRKLFDGYFCCAVPEGHPLAGRDRVTLKDLETETQIFLESANAPIEMETLQREIRMKCFKSTLFYSSSSLYSIPMIEAGMGIAVMPSFVVPQGAKVKKIPFETERKVSFGIYWRKDEESEKVREFVRISREVLGGKKKEACSSF